MSLADNIRETYRRIRETGELPVWLHVIPEMKRWRAPPRSTPAFLFMG